MSEQAQAFEGVNVEFHIWIIKKNVVSW
jgi:hypothetical protein